jgi:deoxyadenosine/deoxycytidine kinase
MYPEKQMPFFIEGNIGVGKSTIIRLLDECGIKTMQEPVESWTSCRNTDGKNVLENFYEDPQRWAYTFQSIAFRSRVRGLDSLAPDSVAERSILTDRRVFAEVARTSGNITNVEWDDYTDWFDWVISKTDQSSQGFVYLRADPDVCHQRIQGRARAGEGGISIEYLQQLHERHDDWLLNESNVLVLDMNRQKPEDVIQPLLSFLRS